MFVDTNIGSIEKTRERRVDIPDSAPADGALVSRACEGDTAAFERLFRTHVGRVYALCLRMSGDKDRSDELTQQVFIRAWERLSTFRGESAFSTWLHRLAVNVVLVDSRSAQRRSERSGDDAALEEWQEPAQDSMPGVRLDLDRAIALLPPQARWIFILHDIEGYTHEEIASRMGLATGTSKAQLHRARRLLQKALK